MLMLRSYDIRSHVVQSQRKFNFFFILIVFRAGRFLNLSGTLNPLEGLSNTADPLATIRGNI
jgi:hypothetical protein